ncbi:Acetyltransferase (GNAT) family protein [Lentzea xinjiangensis]|uniref:Acetyltransferase (GNAT) family protein n=1 Tax=Lentzea xinjiangensis TaxID=402600 RepID=A0A1H9TXS5_9PSEU|nr:GNAT family N-acetyltransferase [Lentzea xinjiangensis]SES01563.1 Acetyltransferase (GNAT) family protein [Lentzea xinjiangensis]
MLLKTLQEYAARAQPAAHVEEAGGWWLRHSPGDAWWVGSVLPHDREDRVDLAEEFCAERGSAARFQITPGVCADGLDAQLDGRGYERSRAMSLQIASTAEVLRQADADAGEVTRRASDEWLAAWQVVTTRDVSAERDLLSRVEHPSAYACARVDGQVVAVGRAVAEQGWAGVFGMTTLPSARSQGAARSVLAALASWAATREANHMYLQMDKANSTAFRLYERTGFREVCTYHYRLRGQSIRNREGTA